MKIEAIRLSPTMSLRKAQVLGFIRDYFDAHQYGPSLREIAEACGTNKARVQDAIRKLEREQKVNRTPGKARGVEPIRTQEWAIRELERRGYIVNPGRMELLPPPPPLIDLDEAGRVMIVAR